MIALACGCKKLAREGFFMPFKRRKRAKFRKIALFLKKSAEKFCQSKKCLYLCSVKENKMVISSSGLGRRPLTAETRVRVPVSLPSAAIHLRRF